MTLFCSKIHQKTQKWVRKYHFLRKSGQIYLVTLVEKLEFSDSFMKLFARSTLVAGPKISLFSAKWSDLACDFGRKFRIFGLVCDTFCQKYTSIMSKNITFFGKVTRFSLTFWSKKKAEFSDPFSQGGGDHFSRNAPLW